MLKRIVWTLAVIVAVVAIAAGALRWRYGGGQPYRDLSGEPLLGPADIEVVVATDVPIGNAAVSAGGRIFFTEHPESGPPGAKLYEWVGGRAQPYPSAEVQDDLFQSPLGLAVDRQNRLWVIDPANHGTGQPRLLAFDLATGDVVHRHDFTADVAPAGSFLQDLQVDAGGATVYIADVGFWRKAPALVVYDVEEGKARRVLDGHPSVYPEDWIIRNPIKDMVFLGGLMAMKPGVDGIALEPSGTWLYYAAMAHDTMFRIRTTDLRNPLLSDIDLAARIEVVGAKPLNDGLSSDKEGNIYLTDVEHSAVIRMAPDGTLTTLVKDARIRWADGLSYGPDGWLYLADSAIPHLALQSRAHAEASAPYYIFRFKPGIGGVPGQ